jgi:DNA repair protein RadA/Sms
MSRVKTVYRCSECGAEAPKWMGWCTACEASGTLTEEQVGPSARAGVAFASLAPPSVPVPIAEAVGDAVAPVPTGEAELDRVLGGGLVPGSVTVLGGEPGVGKSTLLLQALAAIADGKAQPAPDGAPDGAPGLAGAPDRSAGLAPDGAPGQGRGRRRRTSCLYVTAEESARQVALRAERLGVSSPSLWLVAETSLANVLAHIDALAPDVVAIDSIQTVHDPDLPSAPGSVGQVRGCAQRLVGEAKARDVSVVLVGHVTKEGGLAGPRVLEHLVDTVLAFDGERHHALRMLRAVKHRFGSTHELGLFEMGERGLTGVPDPSALFLADRQPGVPGSVVAPVLDGQRPLLVEVQALVVPSNAPSPRRTVQGVDAGRLNQVLAVLDRHAELDLSRAEVHVAVAGGVRVPEPGADLAMALAVVSSATERPLPAHLVTCGEVGLGGELRQVHRTERRLAEAARLGFRRAVVPRSAPDAPAGMRLARAASIGEAIHDQAFHLSVA